MYCKNCGEELKPGTNFCGKCGTKQDFKSVNISKPVTPPPINPINNNNNGYNIPPYSGGNYNPVPPIDKNGHGILSGNKKIGIIACAIAAIIVIVLIATILSAINSNGSKSKEDAVSDFVVAMYEEDVNTIISLVPDDILKGIMKENKCSKSELKKAVKEEIHYESDDYDHCASVKKCFKTKTIDEKYYDDYFDYRAIDCMDLDKVSNMATYQVDVENNYYYNNIAIYQYGHSKRWYNAEATTFVAYAVWSNT